jgi:diguanylate cyclase (GGDEF)-like protein/PAS domain S-box-containing protein
MDIMSKRKPSIVMAKNAGVRDPIRAGGINKPRKPAKPASRTQKQLAVENQELRARVAEAEEILRAIRTGEVDAILVSGVDGDQIYTLKQAESALQKAKARAQLYLDIAAVMFLVLDTDQKVILINKKGCEILGYAEKEIVGLNWSEHFLPHAEKDRVAATLVEVMKAEGGQLEYFEGLVLTKSGQERLIAWRSAVLTDEADQTIGIVSSGADITERIQLQNAFDAVLREQSIRDHLTGLFNRRYMEETLERELHRATRRGLPVGIIMFDIDNFKQFNDTYGHAAGDAILHLVGSFLLEHVRGEDIACRYGGDEFIIILPDASLNVTRERSDFIYNYFRQFNLQFEEQSLEPIMLSMGIGVSPDDDSTVQAILKAVDDAMYKVKREGRDHPRVAKP